MSLPVRRPPSQSQLQSPPHKPSPSSPSISEKTLQEQTPKPFVTPVKSAAMLQPVIGSSPLSSLPSTEAVASPGSDTPTQLSPSTPTRTGSPLSDHHATAIQNPTAGRDNQPQSPSPTTPNMAKKRMSRPPPKRSREDDNEQDPPPLKKATRSANGNLKAKAKTAPKQSVANKPATRQPAAKKARAPPPLPSSRPSRNRKAPERFEDFEEMKPPKELSAKKGASKVFDPVFITTNSTSRLGKADVYHMLLEPAAWTSLSVEQQASLVSMLPQDSATVSLLAKIKGGETESTRPRAFTLSNDCFRTDVAKFKEDLKNGHLAKTWQAAAEQAVIERAAGEYDTWKAEEAELWWGQKSKTTE